MEGQRFSETSPTVVFRAGGGAASASLCFTLARQFELSRLEQIRVQFPQQRRLLGDQAVYLVSARLVPGRRFLVGVV